jgi:hypothetical protein
MCCFVHTSDECESSSPFLDDEMHETLGVMRDCDLSWCDAKGQRGEIQPVPFGWWVVLVCSEIKVPPADKSNEL